jgi:FHA domain/Double zinc ribbon
VSQTCPNGHPSDTDDYCSACGLKMGGTRAIPAPIVCPACRETALPTDKFCERCGADLSAAVTPAEWEAVARADRDYFDRFVPHDIEFPAASPERRFALEGSEVSIGRRSRSKGVSPTIDLSAAPEDPAISRQHAILVRQRDDTWAVVDPGSTNGVYLDDAEAPLVPNIAVPLPEGAQIHLGAWTTITVRRILSDAPDHRHLPC